jgi:predicted cupin superfamily sugar epimerase
MNNQAAQLIERLNLEPHPEGGYYRQIYRSTGSIPLDALGEPFDGDRAYATSIYFLLAGNQISRLHRIRSDEIWHFYLGGSLTLHLIDADGRYDQRHLGPNLEQGQAFQQVVPAGAWFGADLDTPESYALVGCTVAPGFEYSDFELGSRRDLLAHYPQHREIILKLTVEE